MTKSETQATVAPLALWQRLVFTLLGLTVLGVGVWAVFYAPNDIGATTLVLAGIVTLIVALLGVLPGRVSIGDVEFVLGEVLETAVETVGANAAPEILARVDQLLPANTAASVRERLSRIVEYQQRVLGAIGRVTHTWEGVHGEAARRSSDTVDALVETTSGRVAIEIRSLGDRKNSASRIREVLAHTTQRPGPWLLIGDRPVSTAQLDMLERAGVGFVVWRDESDDPALAAALARYVGPKGHQ